MTKFRRESSHASIRKHVGLCDLKLVDKLVTGIKLRFTYSTRVFEGILTSDAYIACKGLSQTSNARKQIEGICYYDKPSNWTSDCIASFVTEHNISTKTNPSGYDRVKVGNKSLNQLRDEYLRDYNIPTPKRPDDIIDIAKKPAKSRTSATSETSSSSSGLDDDESSSHETINQLRASGKTGFRNISKYLEQTIRVMKKEHAKKISVYETLIKRLIDIRDTNAVLDSQTLLRQLQPQLQVTPPSRQFFSSSTSSISPPLPLKASTSDCSSSETLSTDQQNKCLKKILNKAIFH